MLSKVVVKRSQPSDHLSASISTSTTTQVKRSKQSNNQNTNNALECRARSLSKKPYDSLAPLSNARTRVIVRPMWPGTEDASSSWSSKTESPTVAKIPGNERLDTGELGGVFGDVRSVAPEKRNGSRPLPVCFPVVSPSLKAWYVGATTS